MPTRLRDDSPERKREKRESRTTTREDRPEKRDREKEKEKDKEKDREKKPRAYTHRSNSTKEKTASRTSLSSNGSRKRSSMPAIVVEEETNLSSNLESRPRSAYPPLSKEHSKESVGPRPDVNPFTPPSTDVNASRERIANVNRIVNGPPSPPLTDKTAGRPKPSPAKHVTVDTIVEEEKEDKGEKREKKEESDSNPTTLKTHPSKSSTQLRKPSDSRSPVARVRSKKEPVTKQSKDAALENKNVTNTQHVPSDALHEAKANLFPKEEEKSELGTILSSDATSIAPNQPTIQRPAQNLSQPVFVDEILSHPRFVSPSPHSQLQTPIEVILDPNSAFNTPSSAAGPPPPPPPPTMPSAVPRVDYLLQHGGLNAPVPKNLLYAGKPMAVQHAAISPAHSPIVIANLFDPFNQLLGDYEKVMSKNGSLAVATGYKSVARRLLDRLEAVFARDLSAEVCTCSICGLDNDHPGDVRGVSWGEILELVSGRKELAQWPPFTFVDAPHGLGLQFGDLNLEAPMQKLDIDVPEEYREHYIRQSQKTKQSVDRWLNRQQGNDPSTEPPEDVDDETLTFAILTHIPTEQRPIFKDLLGIIDLPVQPPRRAPSPDRDPKLPVRVVPTPMPTKVRPDYIIAAGLAIQRLYRLSAPPRDPETAIYLLNNPFLHHPLATLAAVSSDEWDILISGRFDGFLRSGAEDDFYSASNGRYTPQQIGRMPSRGATPAYGPTRSRQNGGTNTFQYPRPSTAPGYRNFSGAADPGKSGAPIALDEETEIATLAEIERDIFVGMEALEDAFEQLHFRAEAVRDAILERSAGLAAAQRRRKQSDIEIRAGTPASHVGSNLFQERWEVETDDGLGDDVSELAPDDSASNISSNRKRKQKRRHQRRTPVVGPIDEEDESEGYFTRESSPEKR